MKAHCLAARANLCRARADTHVCKTQQACVETQDHWLQGPRGAGQAALSPAGVRSHNMPRVQGAVQEGLQAKWEGSLPDPPLQLTALQMGTGQSPILTQGSCCGQDPGLNMPPVSLIYSVKKSSGFKGSFLRIHIRRSGPAFYSIFPTPSGVFLVPQPSQDPSPPHAYRWPRGTVLTSGAPTLYSRSW